MIQAASLAAGLGLLAAASAAGVQGSPAPPPPTAAGPGIVLGPDGRPLQVQDYEIAEMMMADWQLERSVARVLARSGAAERAFARLERGAACRAFDEARRSAQAAETAAWRAAFVRAARSAIPEDVLKAVRSSGARQGDALLNAYLPRLQAAIGAEGEPVARRVAAAAEAKLAAAASAAPGPPAGERDARLATVAALRARPDTYCG